jgi:hypothetical protein
MVTQITLGLAQAAPALIPAATQLASQLAGTLIKNAPMLLAAGLELLIAITAGILSGLADLGKTADDLVDSFVAKMLSSNNKVLQVGVDVITKIQEGIESGWSSLVNWFNNLWDSLFGNRSVNVGFTKTGPSGLVDGSHASGLDYVPFDGYLARLHRGEAVLTAAEAAAYRSGKDSQNVKQFNLTINTQSLSREELDSIIEYVNRKLGDDL